MNDKFNGTSFYLKPLFALCRFSPPDSKRGPALLLSFPSLFSPFCHAISQIFTAESKEEEEAESVTKKGKGSFDYEEGKIHVVIHNQNFRLIFEKNIM